MHTCVVRGTSTGMIATFVDSMATSMHSGSSCCLPLLHAPTLLPATATTQGRAACEIDTADELLATELMFNDAFRGLDPPQLAALVSCLVPVERTQDAIKLSNELAGALRTLQDTARHIAEV